MSRLRRLAQIARVVGRYRLDELIPAGRLPDALHLALRLNPWRARHSDTAAGERLRRALEELGPVFIKFGQLLSTRRDLLPPDYADALAKLQDQVSPFSAEEAVAIIEEELGKPVSELFPHFDRTPLASASVAQVHSARLCDGREVVVKVVRPDIEATIRQDLALMYTLARLIERFAPDGRRLRPVEVVADYEVTILDELDLGREAANTSQLRRNFEDGRMLYVPEVWWPGTRRRVFTMERIYGIPVTDLAQLRDRGTDLRVLAERGVEIFFTQVLRDSFFHADMHPGNIFVDADKPDDPRYIAIDCAIIGSLSEPDQYYLARNLLAIFQRDYREVARLHVECGWVAPDTRIQEFEATMRAVCEPIFERPISEISFGQLLIYLFRTARRFDMEVQPSLILLQKTLLNIEGLGRQLYPELNLWDTALPFLEQWMRQRYAPQQVLRRLQREAPGWLEQLPAVPELILESLRHGRERDWRESSRQRQHERRVLLRSRRRWAAAVAISGAALLTLPAPVAAATVPAAALLAVALLLLWPRAS